MTQTSLSKYRATIYLAAKRVGRKFGQTYRVTGVAESPEEFISGVEKEFPDSEIDYDSVEVI